MLASLWLMPVAVLSLVSALGLGEDPKLEIKCAWKVLPEGEAAKSAPLGPVRVPLEWQGTQPTPAGALPVGFEQPRFTSIEIRGRKVQIVLGRTSAEAASADRAWIDLDGNGTVEDSELFEFEVQQRKLRDGRINYSGTVSLVELQHDGHTFPITLTYSQVDQDGPRAMLLVRWYLEGRVDFEGRQYAIVMQDGDGNGRFEDEQDRWGMLQLERLGQDRLPSSALLARGEGLYLDGHRVAATVKPGGRIEIVHKLADGPDPEDLARIRGRIENEWAARFDRERAQFVVDQGLDTQRAVAETPIQWRWVTFDQALELAARENKPLFADVMAFWCVWCYRMDYYTYPDAEVARLLNERFIPIKIIQEQDPAGDYQRVRDLLEARGIPAMGIFGADGKVLHKISGWKKPEAFLTELEQGLGE